MTELTDMQILAIKSQSWYDPDFPSDGLDAIVFARAIIAAHEAQRQAPAQPAALFGGPRLTPFGTREFWGTLLDGVTLRADTPLYTSPQPVTKPMTQIEINAMIDNFPAHSWDTDELIVRAVERHHGIGKS